MKRKPFNAVNKKKRKKKNTQHRILNGPRASITRGESPSHSATALQPWGGLRNGRAKSRQKPR